MSGHAVDSSLNVMRQWRAQTAKELDEVFKHEAEPVFSRSPITGRCTYENADGLKPAFIRRKTPTLAGLREQSDGCIANVVGCPRYRCGTADALLRLQRNQYEAMFQNKIDRRTPHADPFASVLSETAKNSGQERASGENIGALEALRRLKEAKEALQMTEVVEQPNPQAAGDAGGSSASNAPIAASSQAPKAAEFLATPRAQEIARVVREAREAASANGSRESGRLSQHGPNLRSIPERPPGTPQTARESASRSGQERLASLTSPLVPPGSARRSLHSRERLGSIASHDVHAAAASHACAASLDGDQRWERWRDAFPPAEGSSSATPQAAAASRPSTDAADCRVGRNISTGASTAAPPDSIVEKRPSTAASASASGHANLEKRPATASSAAAAQTPGSNHKVQTPASLVGKATSVKCTERRTPNTSVPNTADLVARALDDRVIADIIGSIPLQSALRPVAEEREATPDLMKALDIPPPTADTLERKAYFLEGFSPRHLPPLTPAVKSSRQREPPQVMVLETPPVSSCGTKPLMFDRSDVIGCRVDKSTRPQADASFSTSNEPKEKSSGRSGGAGSKSKQQAAKQPALPKKKPTGSFYIGGKPMFGSKS